MPIAAILRSTLFWSGSVTFVLLGLIGALYGPALPALARTHALGTAEAGLIVAVHNGGGLLGLVLSAAFGAVSARQAMALALVGAGLIATGLGWPITLLGALVLGSGYALAAAVLNRRFLTEMGPRGPAMLGFVNAVFAIGAMGAPVLLAALGGVPALAFAAVAVAALLLIPVLVGEAAQAAAPIDLRAALKRPGVMALGALGVGVETSVVGFGPVGLIARGMAEADAAALISGFFACFLVGRLSLVWIAVRVAPRYLLGGAFGLTGALLIAAQMGPPQIVFALAGAPVGILFPAYFYVASRRLGEGGRAAALIMAAVYVGAILTPVAMSLVIAELGAGALFPALAVLALAGAVGSLSLRRAAV